MHGFERNSDFSRYEWDSPGNANNKGESIRLNQLFLSEASFQSKTERKIPKALLAKFEGIRDWIC